MTYKIRVLIFSIISIFLINSCVPPKKEALTEVKIDLRDSIYRAILDFQDKRLTDSLVPYFINDNPTYRYASVLAFASIKDTNVVDEVIKRLNDNVAKVREAAAYTLGQIGVNKAQDSLLAVFGKYDTINQNSQFNANILEAIGKIGDKKYLKPLATVKNYRPTDTLLLLGQTRGLYQYIVRNISDPEGTERIIDLVGGVIYPKNIRTIGSFYLVKARKDDLNNYIFRLIKLFNKEQDPFIKMNLANAIGKTQNPEALKVLKEALISEETADNVKVNIVKSLGNFDYINVVESVLNQLENQNNNLSLAAADYLYMHGQPNDVIIYRKFAKKNTNWNVKARLYNAILKHIPTYFSKTKSATIWEIKKQIQNSENQYEKAEYIRALGEDINSFKLLYENGFKAPEIPVRTASVEALAVMMRKESIKKLPKWKLKNLKKDVINMIVESFKSGDVGLIYSAVDVLNSPVIDFKSEFENFDFFTNTKKSLSLPKDVEAYNEIAKLEAKWFNKTYIPASIEFNNPIDWNLFDKLPENPRVLIKTNKGDFVIKLFKNESPGSVTNFIKLTNEKFFEGKKFHRVVPNFVIQTGCPRGDGFGSLNYTIRSELSQLNYSDAGFVGMASAGNDTESTQWFVTLTPTPHLDGKYTILGKVTKGIDTVNKILLGDIINSVEIVK